MIINDDDDELWLRHAAAEVADVFPQRRQIGNFFADEIQPRIYTAETIAHFGANSLFDIMHFTAETVNFIVQTRDIFFA